MNPLIPTVFSADPSAHVWPGDDRLWIYASHDQPGTNNHDTMDSYHVFSSTDLVNWTDYGPVLHLKDVKWAISHMWAIDAVLWKGLYYLVYCAVERESGLFKPASPPARALKVRSPTSASSPAWRSARTPPFSWMTMALPIYSGARVAPAQA
jgi:hypothetical protein